MTLVASIWLVSTGTWLTALSAADPPAAATITQLTAKEAAAEAEQLVKKGEDLQALPYLDHALQLDRSAVDVYRMRAGVYIRSRAVQKALPDIESALRLGPQAIDYHARGIAKLWLQQPTSALADFTEALRRDPSLREAYQDRAQVHFQMAHYQKAVNDLTEEIRLNSADWSAYDRRSKAFAKLGQQARAEEDRASVKRLFRAYAPNDEY